jgi:hypothetical protein
MPTASALGKTYCPQCGWNRDAAEKQTRLLLRLLPVLVIVFDAPLIVWIFIGHAEVPVLAALGVLAIVPVILVVLVVRGNVRVGAIGTRSAQSAGGTSSIASPSDAVAEQYTTLAELPRPRPVRMSRQGRTNVTVISVALVIFAVALVAMVVMQPASGSNFTPPRPVVYLLPLGLVAVIAFVMRRSLAQQRWLLAEGKLAMARVTKQWAARNGHGIRYEFTTPAGETFSRMTTDGARQLLVGMSVPIFYDPEEPKKQVALCAAFYEVVLPGRN